MGIKNIYFENSEINTLIVKCYKYFILTMHCNQEL